MFWTQVSRVAPDWDLWRTLNQLGYRAAAFTKLRRFEQVDSFDRWRIFPPLGGNATWWTIPKYHFSRHLSFFPGSGLFMVSGKTVIDADGRHGGKNDQKFGSKLEARIKVVLWDERVRFGDETWHPSIESFNNSCDGRNFKHQLIDKTQKTHRNQAAAYRTVLQKCARLFSGMRKLWVKLTITKGAPTSSQWLPHRDQPR